jgi:hypothetical protein
MTDPIVRLETPQLSVEPGGQTRTILTVRNLGTIVEGFRLQVLGESASEWAEISPDEVQVYPEQEATAVVVFSPPTGTTTRSGTFPFGVRAESVVDPSTSAVAEGDLEIGRVFGLQSKLTPVTSSGRWRGKHFIELTNWGNSPVQLRLVAGDPDDRLAFLLGPETVDLPLGVTGHARLMVKTKKPFLRGAQVRLPFQVVAEPDPPDVPTGPPSLLPNPRRAVLDGAFTQRAVLSKLTVTVAVLGVLALAGGIAYALTRPAAAGPAELAQGQPRTPELTALARNATTIQLLWQDQSNVTTYRIHQLTADGKTSGVQEVDGALNTHPIEELQPSTKYCFELEAVRGDQSSPISDARCATTGAAAASASPSPAPSSAPPTGSSAAVSGSAAAAEPGSSSPGPGAATSAAAGGQGGVVPPPVGGSGGSGGGGSAGSPQSAASSAGGTATSAPSGSPTASTGAAPTFTANQFVTVLSTVPVAQDKSAELAEAGAQQLGPQAKILRTKDFPDLRLIAGAGPPIDSYLIYTGPFGTREEAQKLCDARPAGFCLVVQPKPNG